MATSFLTLQTEVADRLNLDISVTANATRVKRWINLIINDIASRYPFEFLFSRTFIQTVADKTAGTVSVSAAGTTVTGVGTAFASTDKRSFIQFANDTNWYEVSAYGSATSLTITPALAGSAISGGTYTLRKVYYNLPTDLFQVFDVRQSNTPLKLTQLGIFTLDSYQPDINIVSAPTAYYLFRDDPDTAVTGAKQRQIGFFPVADSVYNMEVRYFLEQVDLSGSTDIPLIPVPYYEVILSGAEWLGSKFINDPKEENHKKAYEFGIQKMIDMENALGDWLPVVASSDTDQTSRFLPFPATYEQPR